MLAFLEGPDLLIVAVIVVLLFGGSQLPKFARSLGQAKKELDVGLREGAAVDTHVAPVQPVPVQPVAQAVPVQPVAQTVPVQAVVVPAQPVSEGHTPVS